MVGNRDPNSQFNLVTQGQRQPGSAFKPFALIAALEQGIEPETEFVSEKKEYMVEVPGLEKPEKWTVEELRRDRARRDDPRRGPVVVGQHRLHGPRDERRRQGPR